MNAAEVSENDPKSDESPGNVFRTVLPHEPLPSNDGPGFLHIQGSFQPKSSSAASETETNATEDKNVPEASQESSFWTRDTLQRALDAAFTPSDQQSTTQLAVLAANVQILDHSPPFTKIRLEYATPSLAFRAMAELKRRELAPSTIFANMPKHLVPASAVGRSLSFNARPFQVSFITKQPLASPGWTRSNPPKFRRLIARNVKEDEVALQQQRQDTRFVWMSSLFARPKQDDEECYNRIVQDRVLVAAAIRAVVDKFDSTGRGVEVFLSGNKLSHTNRNPSASSCYIGMRCAADAQSLIQALQGQSVLWTFRNDLANDDCDTAHELASGALFLDYAAITQRSAQFDEVKGMERAKRESTRPECTSATAHVNIPGLIIVEDFVTEAQEAALVAVLTGPQAPWAPAQVTKSETGTVKRRVQHYGYVFDYKTADVLRVRSEPGADCPPMPALMDLPYTLVKHAEQNNDAAASLVLDSYLDECVNRGEGWGLFAGIVEQVRRHEFGKVDTHSTTQQQQYPTLNQITINEYRPGEGIGSHVDTPSAFGDGLLSLSLNSGIVMEFRKGNADEDEDRRKLVYLPRRSIILMSGPARYEWEHMIVSRRTDQHNSDLLPRGLRISLTFRTALDQTGSPMPLVQSNTFPPIWGHEQSDSSSLRTPACERDHVHAVYDAIAVQWHHTRGRKGVLWPGATKFLQELLPGSVVADVGCGDGKYFPAIWQGGSYVIGTDISIPLLKTAFLADQKDTLIPESRRVSDKQRQLRDRPAVCAADCMFIPLQSKRFDAAICIAVLHHLSTKSRRRRCIEELVRIVKPGGLINIQAWALTQEKESRRTFAASDVYVPFNAQPKHLTLSTGEGASLPKETNVETSTKSTAQLYSEAMNAEYDDRKGLVVFKRYCHMYKDGELEALLVDMPDVELVEAGFEAGNYYMIVRVVK